jgi:hypothetical protein
MPRRSSPSGSAAGSKLVLKASTSSISSLPRARTCSGQPRRLHRTVEQGAAKLALHCVLRELHIRKPQPERE